MRERERETVEVRESKECACVWGENVRNFVRERESDSARERETEELKKERKEC